MESQNVVKRGGTVFFTQLAENAAKIKAIISLTPQTDSAIKFL